MNKRSDFQNPFDESAETEKHKFFREMTSAINAWMLEVYPQFDSRLGEKIFILEKETELVVGKLRSLLNETEKTLVEKCKNEINEFLDEKFPGMDKRLSEVTQNSEMLVKRLSLKEEKIHKLIKNLYKSDTLYEDVYKIRDDMKELKKVFKRFQDNMRILIR